MLLASGVSPRLARFALSHGNWEAESQPEDLLVALADTCWKGKRLEPLEEKVARIISDATSEDFWTVYLSLTDLLEHLAEGGPRRLELQNGYPC